MSEQRRAGEVDADAVDRLRRLATGVLDVVERDLDRRRVATAVAPRPLDADPSIGGELRLPPSSPVELVVGGRERGWRLDVRAQPVADLGRERFFFRREGQVHLEVPEATAAGARRGRRATRARRRR